MFRTTLTIILNQFTASPNLIWLNRWYRFCHHLTIYILYLVFICNSWWDNYLRKECIFKQFANKLKLGINLKKDFFFKKFFTHIVSFKNWQLSTSVNWRVNNKQLEAAVKPLTFQIRFNHLDNVVYTANGWARERVLTLSWFQCNS